MYSRATRLRPTARGIHVRSTRGAACACLVSAGARSAAGRPGMGSADYPIGQKRTETGRTRGGCTPEPGTATRSARRPSRREARIELRRSVHAVAQPPPAAPSGAERRGTGCNQGSASRGGSAKVPQTSSSSVRPTPSVSVSGARPGSRIEMSSDIHDDIFKPPLPSFSKRTHRATEAPRGRARPGPAGRAPARPGPARRRRAAAAKVQLQGHAAVSLELGCRTRPRETPRRPARRCGRAPSTRPHAARPHASGTHAGRLQGNHHPAPRPAPSVSLSLSLSLSRLSLSLSDARSSALPDRQYLTPLRNRTLTSASGDALPLAGLIACALFGRHVASRP